MKKSTLLLLVLLLLLAALATSLALAQGNTFSLDWWTVDGGGDISSGSSSNGRFTLQATIGQPDAGQTGSGRYTLTSGFWDSIGRYDIHLPLLIRP
ncbi:MAG: hypothetical protein R3293_21375 [Candidatus Promineifilaceae bacterium]|nr:hypothetical protein [Candidatus Promineifilaceae bacterium]